MTQRTIADLLGATEFVAGLDADAVAFIAGCGHNVHLEAGEYLFREGEDADRFYILREGRVALEMFVPGRGALVIDTVGPSQLLGVSWLVPPYRWMFDGRAVEAVRAVALDGTCIRAKCDDDPGLGYELMKRVAVVLEARLQSARVRLLDLYGTGRGD
jgi:CRP/FNR family transcriptional regulator, cyclic AMP receptor protein